MIEVLEVSSHVACIGRRNGAVNEEFGGGEVGGFSAEVQHTRRGFVFSGLMAEKTRKFVALRPLGMSDMFIKNIVLVPF